MVNAVKLGVVCTCGLKPVRATLVVPLGAPGLQGVCSEDRAVHASSLKVLEHAQLVVHSLGAEPDLRRTRSVGLRILIQTQHVLRDVLDEHANPEPQYRAQDTRSAELILLFRRYWFEAPAVRKLGQLVHGALSPIGEFEKGL